MPPRLPTPGRANGETDPTSTVVSDLEVPPVSRARRQAAVSVSLLLVLSFAGPYSTSADHGGDQGVNPQGWEGILTQVTSDPEFTHSETGSIVWHLNGPDAPVTADVDLETDDLASTGGLCHGWVKRSVHQDGLPAAPNVSLTVYRLTDGQRAAEPLGAEGGDYYLFGALGVSVDAETTLYYVPQGPGADCPAPIVSTEPIGLISNVGSSAQTYTAEPGWTTLTGTYEFNNGGTWSGSENFALSRSPQADLAITKDGSPEVVRAGGEATFTMIVTNHGPTTALNALVSDVMSGPTWDVVGIQTGHGTCAEVPGSGFICSLGNLNAGESAGIRVTVTADVGTLLNRATASSLTPDPDVANNEDDAAVQFVKGQLEFEGSYSHFLLFGNVTSPDNTVNQSYSGMVSGPNADSRVASICMVDFWSFQWKRLKVQFSKPIWVSDGPGAGPLDPDVAIEGLYTYGGSSLLSDATFVSNGPHNCIFNSATYAHHGSIWFASWRPLPNALVGALPLKRLGHHVTYEVRLHDCPAQAFLFQVPFDDDKPNKLGVGELDEFLPPQSFDCA